MTKHAVYRIEQNEKIAMNVYSLRLAGPTGALQRPGQFANLQIEGFYLRRPISVCDWDEVSMTLIYKIVGKGTKALGEMPVGRPIDVLVGLGNGFDTAQALGKRVVLAGGGVGVPPLYRLAKDLVRGGTVPVVALGFASGADVFYKAQFEALGCEVRIATEDGSAGERGFVTRILEETDYSYYFTCGPQGMLRAVHSLSARKGAVGQLSFEERMGCGFGACMGCSCQTLVGPKRVCVDGPVFASGEVEFT